ncbi:halocyanin hcpB [Salinarchaeum sp. Harcht-Bsk1]|uniref:halocyanin domain-containing protein n=1 Tax=Salinarchaeum sp. Harcht-Bsk1 TaxID=1333523 RepID=UPI0003424283|nr:halocyanin domain-containing protein [Salinarchaeum sp. Harcht-Bsk1]AGN00670.1 halocyanin hcpB [Salinarchaeum sp. Harcht-Bsk1]
MSEDDRLDRSGRVVSVTDRAGQLSRRRVLQTAAGTAAAAAAGAAATGTAAAQDEDGGEGVPAEFGNWFTGDARGGEVQNYDGTTVDRTGESEITVTVGADGNGGTFAFDPPALRISPGTTVTFEWVSDTHNVIVESQPEGAGWEGHDPIEDTGFSFTHTFETEGTYTYFCEPHLSLGMKGGIVVGPAPAGSGGGEGVPAEYGNWFTSDARGGEVQNYDGTTADQTGQSEVSVTVGADGNGGTFAFDPPALRISPGTTVTFEWVSDTHNVIVESQPEGAGWEGHEPIEDTGFSFTHTFETEGTYTYFCEPHLSLGMKGAIVVGAAPAGNGGQPGATAGGGGPPFWVTGLAGGIVAALLAPILVSYYRYWDRDERGRGTEAGRAAGIPAGEPIPEAAEPEPVEEIGHDEYDPMGTAALIVVYALILLGMWVFMYFVEFLGKGPTVIG